MNTLMLKITLFGEHRYLQIMFSRQNQLHGIREFHNYRRYKSDKILNHFYYLH